MQRARERKWKITASAVLTMFFLSMVGTFVFVYSSTLTMQQPVLSADPPAVTEEVQQTVPVISAAQWQSTLQQAEHTAVMTDFALQTAQELVERGFRSVVLPPLEQYNANELAQAVQILQTLGEQGVHRTLTLLPPVQDALEQTQASLARLIDESTFDAIMLADIAQQDPDGSYLTRFAGYVQTLLEQAELDLPVLLQAADFAQANTIADMAHELDNAQLLVGVQPEQTQDFSTWAQQQADTMITAMVDVREALPTGSGEEVLGLLSALQNIMPRPVALLAANEVPEEGGTAQMLSDFFAGNLDMDVFTRGFSLQRPVDNVRATQNITVRTPVLNFVGGSNPLLPLTLNNQAVQRNQNGDFSFNQTLQAGENVFTFRHAGQSYVINVRYEVTLLQSVSPTGRLEGPGGAHVMVTAVAMDGATVTARLGGSTITLRPGATMDDGDYRGELDENFTTFVGTFTLPDSRMQAFDAGTVVYTVSYRGLTTTRNGAFIVVTPQPVTQPPTPPPPLTTTTTEPPTQPPTTTDPDVTTDPYATTDPDDPTQPPTQSPTTQPPTTQPPVQGPLRTPAQNHGLGTARMVEITAGFAETRRNATLDTRSEPGQSPLLSGTFDYVVGQAVINNQTHLLLGSGKRVNANDARIIEQGFRLPANRINASGSTSGGAFTLRLGIDWRIPFNVDFVGQNYSSAHGDNGLPWGVQNFTATGLNITFFHTSAASGTNFGLDGSVFSAARWSTNAANNTATLHLTFRQPGRFFGYRAFWEGNQLVFRFNRRPPATLSGAVIILDPGHGGNDPGALFAPSHPNMRRESQFNLVVSNLVAQQLRAAGATVHMTRTGDTAMTLVQRVAFTRRTQADMFVSIHGNASTSSAALGTETFYYRANSEPLARAIHNRLVRTWREQIYVRANFSNYANLRTRVDRRHRYFPFMVTRVEEMPAVLVEIGFVSHLDEGRAMQNPTHQRALAQAITNGIADYLRAVQ
ncbi:MAG: N-acetylmuramoyl-L-alanine amidase [Oscillospiraceae bacterium]|nr:N-acetylmuramoyl-L-alanine amidase [Oscillospiraceae bacterium]